MQACVPLGCMAICLCYHLPAFPLVSVSVLRNLFARASLVHSLVYLSARFDDTEFKKIDEAVRSFYCSLR